MTCCGGSVRSWIRLRSRSIAIRASSCRLQSTEQIGVSSWLIYGDSFLALPLCLYTLPLAFELNGVWLAMPVSRVLLAALLLYFWFGRRNRAVPA